MPSTAAVVSPADHESPGNGQAVAAQAVLAHASTLARAGRLDEAAGVLVEIEAGCVDVRVLDLLAKVRAQQGRYEDAEALWSRAKALSGSDGYDAALRRIEAVRTRPAWLPSKLLIAAAVIVAAVALGIVRAPSWTKPTAHSAAAAGMQAVAPLQQPKASSPEEGRANAPAAQPQHFSVAGVTQAARDGGVELTLAEGLFRTGVSLRPHAVATLDELGARLGNAPQRTMVVIIGHTDDIPVATGKRFTDNASLGLARATVVMRRLIASSSLPATSFLVGTAADAGGPYPNDTRDNRLRNRTVTLHLMQDPSSR
ncbi:MAG TPA: hypothetical protein VFE30_10220 [Anaeromyxobacteraceae bacterium]|jgi:type VI secretion system protein ImpK|nr:hypothetical protein [Anaeromyxobacteraceae bacterium]